MTTLYICEKPSQGKDIARVLGAKEKGEGCIEGGKVIVTWCLGHLLELAPPDTYCDNLKPWRLEVLPVVPEKWQIVPSSNTKKQLSTIKKLLKRTNHVVIATDADREGDVIGREILDYCNYSGKVERLWLSALDDASIKKALDTIKPGSATENLYLAGLGRQRADWLIGMNLTMAVSSLYSKKGEGVLSVGRVQTPTLKLVVDRDRLIEDFKPKDYYTLEAEFCDGDNKFWTKWQVPEDLGDEEGRCIKLDVVQNIAKKIENKIGVVSEFSQQEKRTKAPLCFSLSELQKVASSKLGLSAKETLQIAQSLYEKHKATTYPRTDCGYLPMSQFEEAANVLQALKSIDPTISEIVDLCNVGYKSHVWNDKKITAHHGIIPTLNSKVSIAALSANEIAVYDLIRRYYLAQFLGDYKYNQRKVSIECEGEQFTAASSVPVEFGWKQAVSQQQLDSDDDNEDPQNIIPSLEKGSNLTCSSQKTETKQTKPPARFTEGTLIAAMKSVAKYVDNPELRKVLKETSGIGTEATRAAILETLFKREYVAKKGKQLISTNKGRKLIDLLPENLKDPAVTAEWEQTLDDIANGKAELEEFIYDQVCVLENVLEKLTTK